MQKRERGREIGFLELGFKAKFNQSHKDSRFHYQRTGNIKAIKTVPDHRDRRDNWQLHS